VRLLSLRSLALAAAVLAGGCFDSLVGGECQNGFTEDGSRCLGPGDDVDASDQPDAAVGDDGSIDPDARDGGVIRDARDGAPGDDDGGTGDDDGGTTGPDGGTGDDDGGTTGPDGGTTGPDGGTTGPDGGGTDPDGGGTDPDGGTTDPDGGGTDPDGGGTEPDGGTTDPDGGTTDPDGGSTDPDASELDAGDEPDASVPDADPDASGGPTCLPEELLCNGECIDPLTDEDNCGRCNNACATGLCELGVCVGATSGHVVLMGHDYRIWRAAAARALGNAVELGRGTPLRIAIYRGDASAAVSQGTQNALVTALNSSGRAYEFVFVQLEDIPVVLREVQAFVVMAQRSAPDVLEGVGAGWQPRLDQFLARGGSMVVLEGTGGQTHRILTGAGLLTVDTPVDITGQTVSVAAPTDAVATAVPSPYRAETTSVSYQNAPQGTHVIVDSMSRPVVIHLTVQ
jgi:hypothetical protein